VFPILTPLAVDLGHPFPILSNLSTSLGVMLRNLETDGRYFARVKVPSNLPQLISLPADDAIEGSPTSHSFIRSLDLIRLYLEDLFPGMIVTEVMPFLGFFSCDPILTSDVVNLFHYLTGLSLKRNYQKLLVAPANMRDRFLAMICAEVRHHQAGKPARLIAKMNQLEDREICDALVEASQAGLRIDLIVRGLCVLNPGIPGRTENIHISSIIGRFLEHSRIYYFRNGANDPQVGAFLIGSADWMHRNLSGRV
jgi:polyphosphate kinase